MVTAIADDGQETTWSSKTQAALAMLGWPATSEAGTAAAKIAVALFAPPIPGDDRPRGLRAIIMAALAAKPQFPAGQQFELAGIRRISVRQADGDDYSFEVAHA